MLWTHGHNVKETISQSHQLSPHICSCILYSYTLKLLNNEGKHLPTSTYPRLMQGTPVLTSLWSLLKKCPWTWWLHRHISLPPVTWCIKYQTQNHCSWASHGLSFDHHCEKGSDWSHKVVFTHSSSSAPCPSPLLLWTPAAPALLAMILSVHDAPAFSSPAKLHFVTLPASTWANETGSTAASYVTDSNGNILWSRNGFPPGGQLHHSIWHRFSV